MTDVQRAVVGFDATDEAWAALHYAAGHCRTVIAVYAETPVPDPSMVMAPGLMAALPEADLGSRPPANPREHHVFRDLQQDTIDGTPLERVVVCDRPASALIAVAQDRDADEVVVGTRRHGRIRAALSSVAHDLIHDADRPVVIVPPPAA